MIEKSDLAAAGLFTKTHGIKGELNATLSVPDAVFERRPFFICEMDGIPVPFFIASFRPKGAESGLIQPDGVDSDAKAKPFVGKTIYVLRSDLIDVQEDDDQEGAYADDLIGYTIQDQDAGKLGVITGIEDSTANALFIAETSAGKTLYIPMADAFITGIDHENRVLHTSLPPELITLN